MNQDRITYNVHVYANRARARARSRLHCTIGYLEEGPSLRAFDWPTLAHVLAQRFVHDEQ